MKQRDQKTTREIGGTNTEMLIDVTDAVVLKSITLQDAGEVGSIVRSLMDIYTTYDESGQESFRGSVNVVIDGVESGAAAQTVQCDSIDTGDTDDTLKFFEFKFNVDAGNEDNPTLLVTPDGNDLRNIKLVIGQFMAIDASLIYTGTGGTIVNINTTLGSLEYIKETSGENDYTINGIEYNDEILNDFADCFNASLFIPADRTTILLNDFLNGRYIWHSAIPGDRPNIVCEWKQPLPNAWNNFEVTCKSLSIHNSGSEPNSASFDATAQIFDMSDVNDELISDNPSLGSVTADATNVAYSAEVPLIRRYFSRGNSSTFPDTSIHPKINRSAFLQQLFASTNGSLSQEYTITFEITATKPGRSYAVRTQTEMPGKLTINVRGMFTSVVMVLIALTTTVVGVMYRRMKLKALLQ